MEEVSKIYYRQTIRRTKKGDILTSVGQLLQ